MNGVLQIEMRRHGGKIVRIVIEVMAVGHLAGAAVAAAVVRDHAIAVTEKEQHLVVPVIGGQRPAVAEHDRLTLAPVLEKISTPSFVLTKLMSRISKMYYSVLRAGRASSHALINQSGEKVGVNGTTAHFGIKSRARLGSHDLIPRFSFFS